MSKEYVLLSLSDYQRLQSSHQERQLKTESANSKTGRTEKHKPSDPSKFLPTFNEIKATESLNQHTDLNDVPAPSTWLSL
jgi:hypothetical protein